MGAVSFRTHRLEDGCCSSSQRCATDQRDNETARESLHGFHYDAQARWLFAGYRSVST